MRQTKSSEVARTVGRIRGKIKPWGITIAFLAEQLGVSRQYAWQIVHERTPLSAERAVAIERIVDEIIDERKHVQSFGERLKAARISAGLTLKQAAKKIGYSWVGVERWEKDICLPEQDVLWKLCSLYCVGESWYSEYFPSGDSEGFGGVVRVNPQYGVRAELAETLRVEMQTSFDLKSGIAHTGALKTERPPATSRASRSIRQERQRRAADAE